MNVTHTDLVSRAERWLRNTLHCRVVLTELVAYTASRETPDAIGWVNGLSIMVECKRTRSDFYADKKKAARVGGRAVGHWRFYLTPPGLLSPDEVPAGWGLYEVTGKGIRHAGGERYANMRASPFNSDRDSEVAMLVSALARVNKIDDKKASV